MINRLISIAPMMDWTDRHDRFFLRLIAKNVLLYTEMITTAALIHGDVKKHLQFDASEHPLALQLGGSDPDELRMCAKLGEEWGYDEINLNVGCPSDRVQSGKFGACLMKEPDRVAECVNAMRNAVRLPVTVKCRIGVDNQDSYEALYHFVEKNHQAGCDIFIIHARKAWLSGLSPKENREIPPLQYSVVHQIKKDFPQLTIIINGGIKTISAIDEQLAHVDGVMIGREAYSNPYFLAEIEKKYFSQENIPSRHEVIDQLIPYVEKELQSKTKLSSITRHILGLYLGQPGARAWRRYISENVHREGADTETIREALEILKEGPLSHLCSSNGRGTG